MEPHNDIDWEGDEREDFELERDLMGAVDAPPVTIDAIIDAFVRLEDEWGARGSVRQAQEARARYGDQFMSFGQALSDLGSRYAHLAVDAFTYAVEAEPTAIASRRCRAEALAELDRFDEAIAEIEQALAVAPRDLSTLLSAAG